MKNASKRNQVIVAIIGALVIVVVAIAIFVQVGGGELLGASVLVITPSNPTIQVPNSVDLSVNAVYDCAWSSSAPNIASLVDYTKETKWVTVIGNAEGMATITAKCGLGVFNLNTATASVQVTPRRTDGRQP